MRDSAQHWQLFKQQKCLVLSLFRGTLGLFFFLILNFFERIILGVNYWESRDLTVSPGHTLKERGSLSSSLMTVRDGCTCSAVGCVNLEAVAVPCRRQFHMVTRGGFFL